MSLGRKSVVDTRFRTRKRTRIICWKLLLDSEWKPLGRGLSLNLVYMRIAPRHFPFEGTVFSYRRARHDGFPSPFPPPPLFFFLRHVERIVSCSKNRRAIRRGFARVWPCIDTRHSKRVASIDAWHDIFFLLVNGGNKFFFKFVPRCFQWKGRRRRKGRAVSRYEKYDFLGRRRCEISTTGEKLRQSFPRCLKTRILFHPTLPCSFWILRLRDNFRFSTFICRDMYTPHYVESNIIIRCNKLCIWFVSRIVGILMLINFLEWKCSKWIIPRNEFASFIRIVSWRKCYINI